MVHPLTQLASQHSLGFVLTALVICLVAGWLLSSLTLDAASTHPSHRPRWPFGVAFVAGLGVWTTHFIAMLGYRPDMALAYDGRTTAMSAMLSIVVVGVPLAMSAAAAASWRRRTALGAAAGLGIGAMHYTGMAAIQGCVQTHSIAATVMSCMIGALALAAARGLPSRLATRRNTCLLFTLGVCGTHFTAIWGTGFVRLAQKGTMPDGNVVISIFTATGAAVLFLGALLTILAAQRFETQERAHSAILATALHNMSNGLIYLDAAGRLQLFNRRFLEVFGVPANGLRRGMSLEEIVEAMKDANGWTQERRDLALQRARQWISSNGAEPIEYMIDDGRHLQVEARSVAEGGLVLTFDDVTKDREAQQRIVELAFRDPLTKLANRRALNQRMERDLHPKQRFKLMLLDLDRFKPVNDTYGHGVGDRLLVQVAERLLQIAGPDHFVARLGGDEMAVLVYGDLDAVMVVAENILERIGRPFVIDDITISIGCSIGICCTDDVRDATELMQFADIALYESKRNGRGRSTCYSPGMLECVAERLQIETDMRFAIERHEFHLAYQPVLALADDRLIGYEALLRWEHPTLGSIAPVRFIPLAEENGQIVSIGAWVLEEACRQAASLPNHLYVAVNVSAVQFRSPLLLSHLAQALARSGLPAHRLEIELTETAIVEDGPKIAEMLGAMRRLGITVAMDDFGTGYSSLAHLRDLPLDRIKIDKSFIAMAETDRHSMAVLRGITLIAQELDIAILAEGVETDSQLRLLRSIGCDAIQGYLIGRPERLHSPQDRSGMPVALNG